MAGIRRTALRILGVVFVCVVLSLAAGCDVSGGSAVPPQALAFPAPAFPAPAAFGEASDVTAFVPVIIRPTR